MNRPSDIDKFEKYLDSSIIVEREKDIPQAKSLFEGAVRKYKNMERLGIDDQTATDYFENLYQAVKNIIQSFMSLKGLHPYSHKAIIAFAIDQLNVSAKIANKLNKFRKLRNAISYRGNAATVKEAKDIQQFFQNLRDDLKPKFEDWKERRK